MKTAAAYSLLFFVTLSLLCSALYAGRIGDVSIHLNGGKDVAYIGEKNTVEIWITNDASIKGMSLAFGINIGRKYLLLLDKEGNLQIEKADHVKDAFDMGGLFAVSKVDNIAPDSVMLGGAAMNKPFPINKATTLCYSFKFKIEKGVKPLKGGVCIDNVYMPPAGSWLMTEGPGGRSYPPTFQGVTNKGKRTRKPQVDADAPAVCFDIVEKK